MANEYTPDLITLIGDDGKEIEFEILDIIENDEGKFYVLYPFFENPEDAVNDSGEYYIFEVTEIDGEEELAEIEMMTSSTELPLFLKSVTMKNFMMKMTNSSFFCI
nr:MULTISPECIES: DUF1292 domain-containing protein [unclassified Ruminococcus]